VNPEPVNVGNLIPLDQYVLENLSGSELQLGIFKPSDYSLNANSYPVIFFIHDYAGSSRSEEARQIISFLNNCMLENKIPSSLVVEIPVTSFEITTSVLESIIYQISTNYRLVEEKKGRILLANGEGGSIACSLLSDFQTTFNACFLFDAQLPEDVHAVNDIYYYVDVTDKSDGYKGNYNLYLDLREKGNDHEFRIRQGTSSIQSTINGLNGSLNYLSKKLKNQ